MPFTNSIVDFINDSLKQGSLNKERFQPAKYYNVASIVPLDGDNQGQIVPGILNEAGEIEHVSPDDIYSLQIYHRVISNVYGVQKAGSYGDQNDMVSTTEMQVFVFAQSDKINLRAEQLEPFIVFGIPGSVSNALGDEIKMKLVAINVISSDLDKLRNFRNEFQGVQFF